MYTIDGSVITTKDGLWAEIRRVFNAPEYFGNNLDALNDLLTSVSGDIHFTHACHMLNALGAYGCKVLMVFYNAAAGDPRITFRAGGRE